MTSRDYQGREVFFLKLTGAAFGNRAENASDELPPFTSIHTIKHPALGEFDLFLSKRKTDDGIFYDAVINHLE